MVETLFVRRRRQAYLRRGSELASTIMVQVFGNKPYPWQQQVIAHLGCMRISDSGLHPAPVLLVRPTGGGKSSVRDVYSIMDGGFSLTITPLLSLGADQEEKLTSRAKQTTGRVVSVHLDEIRALSDQQELINELKLIPPDGHTTVVLFSSPQALLNKTFLWKPFLSWLIENDRLSMVCVDEVHLFVHFGLTFRTEFKQLTPILFDKLKVPGSSYRTTIPLLFMTGTCSKTIVTMIEKITGIGFDTDANVFWPPASEMKHRHVFFDVAYTIQALSLFKKKVGPLLKATTTDKFILYTNTRATVERITPKLTSWIDLEGYKADVLKIMGTLLREQKFYHIRVFTKSNLDNVEVLQACQEDARPFNPQILAATSGAANAGIDDPEVSGVTRLEFPPSLLDVQQEKGRAGRRRNASSDRDWYLVCLSLETFVVLLKRLYNNPVSNQSKSSYFSNLEKDMQDALEMLVLPQFCLNASLELKMGNPYMASPIRPPPCLDSCAYCTGLYKTVFPTIVKAGVTMVLLQLFNTLSLKLMCLGIWSITSTIVPQNCLDSTFLQSRRRSGVDEFSNLMRT
jgi:hypothetical protein